MLLRWGYHYLQHNWMQRAVKALEAVASKAFTIQEISAKAPAVLSLSFGWSTGSPFLSCQLGVS